MLKKTDKLSALSQLNILLDEAEQNADQFLSQLQSSELMLDPNINHMAVMNLDLWSKPSLDVMTVLCVLGKFDRRSQITLHKNMARLGGKAKKPDALGNLITDIVRRQPDVTVKGLLAELYKQIGLGVITSIIEGNIEFVNCDGSIIDSPIKGLKRRLTRVRASNKNILVSPTS